MLTYIIIPSLLGISVIFGFSILNMITYSIFAAISITFGLSLIGIIINNIIKYRAFYTPLTHLNFVTGEKANRYLGVLALKHIILHSFWKQLNPLLTIKTTNRETLLKVRTEMTNAEISHLICFVLAIVLMVIFYITKFKVGIIIPLFICNILFHLYPALLQQYNKRRLDKAIVRMKA